MEAPNQFQLELAIDGYLQQLRSNGNYTPDDILELKSHLQDNIAELKQKQLNDDEAFMVAKKRLGKEEDLNAEYIKVNGNVFYNRDLFVMVLSICTYFLFSFLFTIAQNGLKYFAIYQDKNGFVLGIVNYILQIAIVGAFVYLVFNSKKFLARISRLFSRSPANFSSLLILLLVTLYIIDSNLQRIGSNYLPGKVIAERYNQFTIDHDIFNLVRITVGSVVLIALLAALVNSYKRVKFLDNMVNSVGYIALFCFGVFWDGLASSARMLDGIFNNNILISAVGFGMIWFIGMLIFNLHVKKNILYRNIIFISFGFIMELAAGIWINPHLRNGLPVSVYFIALVAGGGLGYLVSGTLRRKRALTMA